MTTSSVAKVPQMVSCSCCSGHGLVHYDPESVPTFCPSCGGEGVEEARDDRGRFLPWVEVES